MSASKDNATPKPTIAFGRKISPGRSSSVKPDKEGPIVIEKTEEKTVSTAQGIAFGRKISPGRSGGVEKEPEKANNDIIEKA